MCHVDEEAVQCVPLRTGESAARGSGGGCGCPTGRSARSKSPPPPGWDETVQNPQTPQETEEREEFHLLLIWCWGHLMGGDRKQMY